MNFRRITTIIRQCHERGQVKDLDKSPKTFNDNNKQAENSLNLNTATSPTTIKNSNQLPKVNLQKPVDVVENKSCFCAGFISNALKSLRRRKSNVSRTITSDRLVSK
jgi:hypothetical protein